jgi:hypothetical protein
MQGIFLMVMGLLRPRLHVTRLMGRVGASSLSMVVLQHGRQICRAIWGAGNSMLPIAAGPAHGSSIQEGIIAIALRSAAVSLIAVSLLILWGLRTLAEAQSGK